MFIRKFETYRKESLMDQIYQFLKGTDPLDVVYKIAKWHQEMNEIVEIDVERKNYDDENRNEEK